MQEIAPIEESTARRLEMRKEAADESLDELICQLLDETIVEVPLESVLENVLDRYDQIASISVHNPILEPGSFVLISVWLPDAPENLDGEVLGGRSPLYDTPETRLVIEEAETDTRHVCPFGVSTTAIPLGDEEMSITAIAYRPDGYTSDKPVSLNEGIERVRAMFRKVGGESEDEPQEQRPDEQSDPE